MPNRIFREGYLDSVRINQLDAQAERFYVRLLLVVDDFGRCEYNPMKLKSWCFPVCERTRSTEIPRWVAACETAGLLAIYEVDGRRYIQLFNTDTPRAKKSRCPDPPHALASKCLQTQANVSYSLSLPLSNIEAPPALEVLPSALDTNDFRAAWERWKKHRAEKRSKLTPSTTKEQLKKLAAWGPVKAIAALNQAIEKGWIGFFEPDERKGSPVPATPRPQLPDAEVVLNRQPSVSEAERAAQRAAFEKQVKP